MIPVTQDDGYEAKDDDEDSYYSFSELYYHAF